MMQVFAVPAFNDNYIWVLARGRFAAVVDPGDAAPVEAFLAGNSLTLGAILATHHHGDHVGGLVALKAHWKCPAFGPASEDISGLDHRLREGDRVSVPGIDEMFSVLDIPGHTAGHIAYVRAGAEPMLFCGDTLFACGCGRLFEGTAAQMVDSLGKLKGLPPGTRAYCGHEYTMANIHFAESVEPDNAALQARKAREAAKRARGEPTLPTTLADELATNPFLRWEAPEVIASAEQHAGHALRGPVEVFAAIREWKNNFR
jgi:hydroxyacylglutathione hydrolase